MSATVTGLLQLLPPFDDVKATIPPLPFSLCFATTLSGFEINDIGVQARISSAITLPPCSTSFGFVSEPYFGVFAPTAA